MSSKDEELFYVLIAIVKFPNMFKDRLEDLVDLKSK